MNPNNLSQLAEIAEYIGETAMDIDSIRLGEMFEERRCSYERSDESKVDLATLSKWKFQLIDIAQDMLKFTGTKQPRQPQRPEQHHANFDDEFAIDPGVLLNPVK